MKEKQIQSEFSKVCRIKGVFELKLARGNSLPYSALADHQEEALLKVKEGGLFYKIGDSPIFTGMSTRFHAKKPFDCLYLEDYPAYVAICFYIPRKKKEIYIIDIHKFLTSRDTDSRKSITENVAESICDCIVSI